MDVWGIGYDYGGYMGIKGDKIIICSRVKNLGWKKKKKNTRLGRGSGLKLQRAWRS